MNNILQHLKTCGEQFDKDIAKATGVPLATVRLQLAELAAKCEVVACHSVRFNNGQKVEGIIYRIAGYTPPAAPGRKPKGSQKPS